MTKDIAEVYRKTGTRLTTDMSPLVNKYFYASTKGLIYKGFHMLDKAHAVMLAEEGIIPKEAGIKILQALRQMEKEGVAKVRDEIGGHSHCGEAYVTKLFGADVGGWINCARSSGDLNTVAWRVEARDNIIEILKVLIHIRRTFLKKAEEHIGTIMPGYTQLQHGEPLTFAFYLLSWVHQLDRDFERFCAAYHRTNISTAGCGVLSTSDFPINRERLRELLGFDSMFANARDAIWSFDYLFDSLSAMAGSAGTLSKLADDLTIWHSSEFSLVEHPDAYCGTSSIMPQKKNPYGTQCVRALNGEIMGCLMSFLSITKTQSDGCEMPTMSPPTLKEAAEKYLAALQIMDGLVEELKINKKLMAERAGEYWAQGTYLANTIVREKGLPFRTAHQIVGTLVRLAYAEKKTPKEITTGMLDKAVNEVTGKPLSLDKEILRQALDPATIVKSKKVFGGTAPELVSEDIKLSLELISNNEKEVRVMERRLHSSEKKLELAIDKLLGESELIKQPDV